MKNIFYGWVDLVIFYIAEFKRLFALSPKKT